MAESKREGGLYYLPDGTAVDADGNKIKGAPRRQPDTDPSTQPGALNAPSSEEKMGKAIAAALIDASESRSAAREAASASAPETAAKPKLADFPTTTAAAPAAPAAGSPSATTDLDAELSYLRAHLATIETADEVRALQETDGRAESQPLYEARLAELHG